MTQHSKPIRLHLIEDPRPGPTGTAPAPIRRYRIARLRLEACPVAAENLDTGDIL